MAGCNDDIILRKDNVICDKGSGISLKDFVNKLIAEYMASNPSTGGGSGGSGGGTSIPASITLRSTDSNAGVSQDATTISLPNSSPITFGSEVGGMIFKISGNSIVLGAPTTACSKSIATPTLTVNSAVANTTLIDTNLTQITVTVSYALPFGHTNTDVQYPPCPSTVQTSFQNNSFTINFTDTFTETLEYSLNSGFSSTSSSFTFTTSEWTSGTSKIFYVRQVGGSAFKSTDTSKAITITGTTTGVKSDATTVVLTSSRSVAYSTYNIYSGYSDLTPANISSSNIIGSTLVVDEQSSFAINKTYSGSSFSPIRYYYFIAPNALFGGSGITNATTGTNNSTFDLKNNAGDGYTILDSYGTASSTYYKTITLHNVAYRIYVSESNFGSGTALNPIKIS
jgi:hypothetical protein